MKIAIVGLSHQGYAWSIYLSDYFNKIGIFDFQTSRLKNFNNKFFPNYVLNEDKFKLHQKKMLKHCITFDDFSKLKDFDTILITEDVIINKNFTKDLQNLKKNIKQVTINIKNHSNIIIMSQVNPGTTRKYLINKIKNKCSIYYVPDVLTIGTAIKTLKNYKKLLVGGEKDKLLKKNKIFLDSFFKKINKSYFYLKIEEAELVKEAIQLKLSLDVTFANLLSTQAEKQNISFENMINFIKTDSRFSSNGYWRPGLGFGGGHIERGLKYFSDTLAKNDSRFLKELILYNELRMDWIYNFLKKNKSIKNISIWGAVYKKNTSSTFRSYAMRLINKYKNKYNYKIFDPAIDSKSEILKFKFVERATNQFEFINNIDCLLILSDWDQFKISKKQLKNFANFKNKTIVDAYRLLIPLKNDIKKMKINYISIGND